MIGVDITFIVMSALTCAATGAVYLRTRNAYALKYVALLAFLSCAGAGLTAALFTVLMFYIPGDAIVVLVLALLSQLSILAAWSSIMLHLFGVLNGIHPSNPTFRTSEEVDAGALTHTSESNK